MIQSMTGFGKATGTFENMKVVVEIRTLNSKNLDIYLKAPHFFKEKEMEIRKMIGNALDRGKVEAVISIENTGGLSNYRINTELAKSFYEEFDQLAKSVNADKTNLLATILRMPDVLVTEESELSDEEWRFLKKLVQNAIEELVAFRTQEGESLAYDLTNRIKSIAQLLGQVPKFESERISTVRERIKKNLEELKEEVDENRFEQELIFYIEKLDISEEKVRLENHLNYFLETLKLNEPIGKKIGFIAQEIGREVNTLGSKANHTELQKIVVEMKDNLEKIKEQVLNTL